MTKITNNSAALQGVQTVGGVVYLQPNETRDLEVSDVEMKGLRSVPFLGVEGLDRGTALQSAPNNSPPLNGTEAKSPTEVRAMFDSDDTHFMTAKAEAAKLLGPDTPATKAEIVAALDALIAKQQAG